MTNFREKINTICKNNNSFTETISLLQDNFTIDEAKQLCAELSLCNCCDRHLERRPNCIEDNWVEYPKNTNHYYDFEHYYNSCNCNCRQISRFLNRSFSNYSSQ